MGEEIHKGLWILHRDLADKQHIDRFLDDAKTLGFTDLFVQVRARGEAMYRSEHVKISPLVQDPTFDPLEYVCTKAHEKGLKIHAWFNTYILYSKNTNNSSALVFLSQFPDWIEWDESAISDVDKYHKAKNYKLFEGIYLSPLHPQVNSYLLVLIKELITNYEIDGIHLDYVRFQGSEYGYNPTGMKLFYEKYGVNPRFFMNHSPLCDDPELYPLFRILYDQYRCDAISNLIKEIAYYNKSLQNPVFFSAAVKPSPEKAKNLFYQDWATWIKEGWLDCAIPMNYTTQVNVYRDNLLEIRDILPSQSKHQIWVGNGLWNKSYSDFEKNVILAQSLNFSHYVVFSYNVLKEDKGYYRKIKTIND